MTERISNNTLALIALANEYCHALETADAGGRTTFIDSMLRLLPRIYITASDAAQDEQPWASYAEALDEAHYEAVRSNLAALLGEDDTYLDVVQEDMKYSDTPIAATVSEQLADVFQPLYNFVEAVKDATDDDINLAVAVLREEFVQYWSQPLLNALRMLNYIKNNSEYRDFD